MDDLVLQGFLGISFYGGVILLQYISAERLLDAEPNYNHNSFSSITFSPQYIKRIPVAYHVADNLQLLFILAIMFALSLPTYNKNRCQVCSVRCTPY
jgi:hypothetical protein